MILSFPHDDDKMTCVFAVDREWSLNVIRTIKQTPPAAKYKEEEDSPIVYTHKLAVAIIDLPGAKKGAPIETVRDQLVAVPTPSDADFDHDWSDRIDITTIDLTENTIDLPMIYLHGTRYECDWSYVSFRYVPSLRIWAGVDNNDCLDYDGELMILDFNAYKT